MATSVLKHPGPHGQLSEGPGPSSQARDLTPDSTLWGARPHPAIDGFLSPGGCARGHRLLLAERRKSVVCSRVSWGIGECSLSEISLSSELSRVPNWCPRGPVCS